MNQLDIPHKLTLTTPPTQPVVSLDEAKEYLREAGTDQDETIKRHLAAAERFIGNLCARQLAPATWTLSLDGFPCKDGGLIELRRCPVLAEPIDSGDSDSVRIQYLDADGVLQTLDPDQYQYSTTSEPGRVLPAYGLWWPTTRCVLDAVRVEFDCGYETVEDVPETLKQAVLLHAKFHYDNPDAADVSEIVLRAINALVDSERWTW